MVTYNTIIIGAGQAGLAMAHALRKKHESFLLLDSVSCVGDSWRRRYDSLKLFTPRSHSSLPGLKIEGDPSGYPTKDELANYLHDYQKKFTFPVQLNSKVKKVIKRNDLYEVEIEGESSLLCSNIIVATGPFQVPYVPDFNEDLPNKIRQLHTDEYKNSQCLKEGSILIVGGGNSGVQIGVELVELGREVYLSIGKKPKFLPYQILGKSIFWWLSIIGIMRFTVNSNIGQKIKRNDPIIGKEIKPLIRRKRIKVMSRTIKNKGDSIYFSNDPPLKPKNIIWATGYRNDYRWIFLEGEKVFNKRGLPNHNRGVTEEKGLYFIGLSWQSRRGSALLLGVGEDADYIANHISGGR